MSTHFFTGFPGFLASSLLPRVLARSADARAVCLVQAKFAEQAERRRRELIVADPSLDRRIELEPGDITLPNLGLSNPSQLAARIDTIHHLAAAYDLQISRAAGLRINVDGTRQVLDFAASCGRLQRLHYVSTCYVSGRHDGPFCETDLDVGQSFNNHYEETKFLAEQLVRERMNDGLAATIYRPAIVVGDSRTGETQKYDGPYYVIRLLLRQPPWALLPVVGAPRRFVVNIVPRDFVVDAIAHLATRDASRGRTYHLADPSPLTVDELIRLVCRAAGRRALRIRLPNGLAKWSIDHVPGVYRLLQIPSAALAYFQHPTRYDCTQAQRDLAECQVSTPAFPDYVERLVEFVRRNPRIGSSAMV